MGYLRVSVDNINLKFLCQYGLCLHLLFQSENLKEIRILDDATVTTLIFSIEEF